MQITHIDTCLGCYLTDHHNRDGELLLGVIVDGETTYQEVKDELLREVHGLSLDPEEFDYDAAVKAIGEAFLPVRSLAAKFDPSLDVPTDDERDEMLEPCQAWFLFEWEGDG